MQFFRQINAKTISTIIKANFRESAFKFFVKLHTWWSNTVRDIISTISFLITWYIRIFCLSIQDQITNFGIIWNTNEKFIRFKLRQVVIFILYENVNQDDTVILAWISDGFDVTCGPFANDVRIVGCLDLDYVMITLFSVRNK